ncbi:hypothetical protein HID58_007583 [Brassica napus]|uniref:Secreted protein n=1 Tax=Brassica napus TaxID=3708 RepID=A0ABQ8EEM0_BRANA|nr:hypothetical protein HID58_007583 [Brassica napus]
MALGVLDLLLVFDCAWIWRKVGFSSLLPSSTTGVLRTTLDVDVYCGNGEAFFLPSVEVYVLAFFCVNLGFALSTSSSSGAPGREPGARLQVIQMLGATSVRFDRARLQVILLLAVSNQ